jgi:hypothetical protein
MKSHYSYATCLLAVAGLAFSFQEGWRGEGSACPNHALAARLTDELQMHGAINTTKYPVVTTAFVEALVASNAGACLISESASGGPPSGPISLFRDQKTGLYYLVFNGGRGERQKVGVGPVPDE